MKSVLKELEKMALEKGLRVKDCGNGHFQILDGASLVNYYPLSKRKSAYVNGMAAGARRGVTPKQAIEMAMERGLGAPRTPPAPTSIGSDTAAERSPQEWAAILPRARYAWRKSEFVGNPCAQEAKAK